MDFEKMLDEYKNMTCIISVDRTEDGSYGNIRVAGKQGTLRRERKGHGTSFCTRQTLRGEPGKG